MIKNSKKNMILKNRALNRQSPVRLIWQRINNDISVRLTYDLLVTARLWTFQMFWPMT